MPKRKRSDDEPLAGSKSSSTTASRSTKTPFRGISHHASRDQDSTEPTTEDTPPIINPHSREGISRGRDEEEEESARSILLHQKTIEQKLHHHRILLKRALKTAKGFEQQKLGKRIKSARSAKILRKNRGPAVDDDVELFENEPAESNVIPRLEKELEILKELDLAELAKGYLNKSLVKNKRLARSRYFPPAVVREVEEGRGKGFTREHVAMAVNNVSARLVNANPVKEAMKEIISSLELLMGFATENEKASVDNESKGPRLEKQQKADKADNVQSLAHHEETDENKEDEEDEDEKEEEEEETSDKSEHILKQLAARYLHSHPDDIPEDGKQEKEFESMDELIADSDLDSSGDEEEDDEIRSMSITSVSDVEYDDISLDEDDEEEEDISPPPQPPSKPPSKHQLSKSLPPPNSSFLPTLLSGYISGSDDDNSSTSSSTHRKKKGPAEPKPRKNRRGQRERRLIAEKKYGSQAKHVQKEIEEKEEKRRVKEEKKKAWEERKMKKGNNGEREVEEQGMHVSWKLKRKGKEEEGRVLKEIMRGRSGGGRKIVFE